MHALLSPFRSEFSNSSSTSPLPVRSQNLHKTLIRSSPDHREEGEKASKREAGVFMSWLVRSRRLLPQLRGRLGRDRPLCSSTVSANPSKDPIVASGAVVVDQAVPTSSPTGDAGAKGSRAWSALKLGVVAALTGAVGATSYVTYAYSLDELNEKTNGLRSSANWTVGDDASSFDKFRALVYSTAMKVPVKTIELYLDIRKSIEEQVRGFTEPSSEKLLPDLHPQEQHVFTLVLDLNETLVYSDWTRERGWRTFKRPGVDDFLEHMAKFYEVVVYSDQLSMYVDPIIERLDQKGYIRYRLSRNATRYQDGKHFRDLSKLNRDPSRIIYVSGHALENCLQSENRVPIKPFKCENDDAELLDLIPFLEYVARHRPADIRPVLASYEGHDIPTEFIKRSKEHQKRMQEQKQQGFFRRR